MRRLKIMKSYLVLWLFIYFLTYSNIDSLITFFMASLAFNLAVFTVLPIGLIVIMQAAISLVMLAGTFGILAYKKTNLTFYLKGIDKIMPATIAHMFHSRAQKGQLLFTAEEAHDVTEWLEEKFANQSRYTNYFTGTVLMIGLLGTFAGLLTSIDSMGRIILSLSGDIDLGEVIRQFAGPLGGMAVGFGSSLFGVIAAIIMGLMGYILNKNQEYFIDGVEDWLKGRILDVNATTTGSGDDSRASFMDLFIENISSLTAEMKNMSQTNDRLHSITVASVQQSHDEHEVTTEILENVHEILKISDEHAGDNTQILRTELLNLQQGLANLEKDTANDNADIIHSLSSELTKQLEILQTSTKESIASQTDSISELIRTTNEQLITLQHNNEQSIHRLDSLIEQEQISQTILTRQKSSLDTINESLETDLQHSVNQQRQLKTINGELINVKKEISKSSQKELQEITELLSSLKTIQQRESEQQRKLLETQQELQSITKRSAQSLENILKDDNKIQSTYLQTLSETMIESQMKLEDIETILSTDSEKQTTYLQTLSETMSESQMKLKDIETILSNDTEKQTTYLQTLSDTMSESQMKLEEIDDHIIDNTKAVGNIHLSTPKNNRKQKPTKNSSILGKWFK